MTRFVLPLCAALLLATAANAGTTVTTDSRGDTITSTQSCDRSSGSLTCNRQTTIVTPTGAEALRNRVTVFTKTTITSTLSGTRFNGHTFSRTTTVTR